jgi:hypothetical protein
MHTHPLWFGLPSSVVVLVIAAMVWGVGFLWLRASLPGEPEARSFRATSKPQRSIQVKVGIAGVVIAVAAIALEFVAR